MSRYVSSAMLKNLPGRGGGYSTTFYSLDISILFAAGDRYMKKKESVEVPDLDEMTSSSTNELVYDMDQLGL